MTGPKHPTPARFSTQRNQLNLITSMMEGCFDAEAMRKFGETSRSSFREDAIWLIDAQKLLSVAPEAREGLGQLFKAYYAAKGRQIILYTPDNIMRMVVQNIAMHASAPLKGVRDHVEAGIEMKKAKNLPR